MLLYANHTNPTQPLSKYTKTYATSSLVQTILSIVTFSLFQLSISIALLVVTFHI